MQSGDSLENGTTGTRLVWRMSARETDGAAVVLEAFLAPNGWVPRRHVHPRQRQRVEVLAGSVGAHVGRRHSVVGAGGRIAVPAGVPHRFWNAGEETAHLVVETAPALGFEPLLESLFAADGDGALPLALVAAHLDTVRLPFPPARLQRLALALVRR